MLRKEISLQGIQKRKGRPPKWVSYGFDQCAVEAFNIAGQFMKYAKENWDTLTHAEKVSSLQVAMPIALKRIPDQIEQRTLVMSCSIDQETANRMLELANRNLLIYNELDSNSLDAKSLD